ncbi:helix-turn-helix domain-containing protein [Methylomonas montana]|uniref:ArsR/SmtB family transcription factor n=1 Tax=Methylomonas montana TaxID=3058963 RepID=UPI002659F976|nr:helix-turn-helix domain-containing protein [Methylomonas montana]WKJ90343.1 helix-turn-helix domain-containing protein [Methylomonas montana]
MDTQLATTIFESLASAVRLDVYRLLVKNAPDGLVAGEIAAQLGLPPTNLSFHLKAMTYSGLINVTAEGRYQRYRANLLLMHDLIAYLTAECCTGHPEQCFDADAVNACCEPTLSLSSTQTDSPS